MLSGRRKSANLQMRTATSILFLATLLTALLPACKEVKRDVVATPANRDSVVSMKTRDVMTLISDSGMTRYRITAKLWLVYDEARRPNWKFPYGLFLEKFDDNFKVEAAIRCDSAFYFKNDKLWRLDGNVVIRNTKKELIETEQIYWDQTFHEVRSDSFVHIERADRILEGYGFKSDENLHNYLIKKPSGIFPIPKRQETTPPV